MRLIQLVCCLFLFLSMNTILSAQQRNCSSMDHLHAQQQVDPKVDSKMEAIEKHTQRYIANPQDRAVNGVVTIPVVFHVVYRTSTENISDAQIQTQLDVLNEDFRRTNSDADGTWSQAADTEIEFCLATVDPNGNATSGITRTSTNVNGFGTNDSVKSASSGGVNAWNTSEYLNVWVCNIGGGILGYAQFPGGNASTDGVVNGYQYTGTIGTATAPFNLGRTLTHEVGHWLNLRHIWGDGNCNADDFVSDTPTSDGANYGCATGHVSCNTTDMVQNYMDYSDDGCMNLFTEGQKTRMRALFDTGGARASILNSGGCGGGGGGGGATCSDGIQNQGETGVDCGGPCAACPTNCTDNEVTVTITLDNYPEETAWSITNASGATVASGGTYAGQADGSTVSVDLCLADGCYDFTITDAYGDGICCSYGNGSYTVSGGGSTYASGGSFASSETTNFCLGGGGGPDPTCNDGIQNQGETGVDCGGPCAACPTCDDGIQNQGETGVDCGGPCAACPTCDDGIQNGDETGVDCGGSCPNTCGGGGACSYVTISSNDFESGLGIWNDGGSDCRRSANDAAYANSGSYCVRLRDNSGTASSLYSDALNLSNYEEVTIEYSLYAVSMENNEDYFVEMNTGSGWFTLANYAAGVNFENNTRYSDAIVVNGPFPASSTLRFRCDASANADRVYFDDIVISGCASSSRDNGTNIAVVESTSTLAINNVFPNPTSNILNVDFTLATDSKVTISVFDIMGREVMSTSSTSVAGQNIVQLDVAQLQAGNHIVRIQNGTDQIVKKFVKF